jgi:hypothetical protein
MSFYTSFDEFETQIYTNTVARRYFPLTFVNPSDGGQSGLRSVYPIGRNGGQATTLNAVGTQVFRRGTQSATGGRAKEIRVGGTFWFPRLDLFGSTLAYDPGFPTVVPKGNVLFDFRVSARTGTEAGQCDLAACYNPETNISTDVSGACADEQITRVLETGGVPYRRILLRLSISNDGRLVATVKDGGDFVIKQEIIASTPPDTIPTRSWVNIQAFVDIGDYLLGVPGRLYVFVDGELVIEFDEIAVYDQGHRFSSVFQAPTAKNLSQRRTLGGCLVYEPDFVGFHDVGLYAMYTLENFSNPEGAGRCDEYFIIPSPVDDPKTPFVWNAKPLTVTADGGRSETVIAGGTPAATRWQSVATDDGTVTEVSAGSLGVGDLYEHSGIDVDGRDVYGLQVRLRHRSADAVQGASRTVISDGVSTSTSFDRVRTTGVTHSNAGAFFPRAPDGTAWTEGKLNATEIGMERDL